MLQKIIDVPNTTNPVSNTYNTERPLKDTTEATFGSYVEAALHGPYAVPGEAVRFLIENEYSLYNVGLSAAKRKIGEALRRRFAQRADSGRESHDGNAESNAAALGISTDNLSWSDRDVTEAKLQRADATKAAFKAISTGVARFIASSAADRNEKQREPTTIVRTFKGPFAPIGFHETDDLFVSDRTLRSVSYLRSEMNAEVAASFARFVRRILGLHATEPTAQKNIRTAA